MDSYQQTIELYRNRYIEGAWSSLCDMARWLLAFQHLIDRLNVD
jgi:hypothetical protein